MYDIIFGREVAQLASASGLGPEGREFESRLPDHLSVKLRLVLRIASGALR